MASASVGIAPGTTPDALTTLEVTAPHGLHARPAARFVREVGRWPGVSVRVRNPDAGTGPVDGRSLTGIATLDARAGHHVEVSAWGEGAAQVLEALTALAHTGFGDLDVPPDTDQTNGPPVTPETGPTYALEAALGPIHHEGGPVSLEGYQRGNVDQELAALDAAMSRVRQELTHLGEQTTQRVGAAQGAVFEAHLAILEDPSFQEPVRDGIRQGGAAPHAVGEEGARLRAQFEGLADAYQRERGADVTSVAERLQRALSDTAGVGQTSAFPASPAEDRASAAPRILVTEELDPATAVLLDPVRTLGIITLGGGATGHGVLLARARGLPVLTGARALATVSEGTVVAFDARSGRLEIDPVAGVRSEFEELLAQRSAEQTRMQEQAGEPAVTTDGHTVLVKANLASVAEARLAASSGADGSGLVRTEALFGDHAQAPTVAEQVQTFEAIAEALAGGRMTIRTWDVGGDKPLPFHPQPREANPFLGVRGLRAFREDPRLLVDQLEAVCRVAREHPARVMFPMVATVEEVDWALARLEEAAQRLPEGRPDNLEVGIMIEIPAAALRAEALSTLVDFVSIGSNDLTQYTLAAERGSALLQGLTDAADPAVLQLIRDTVTGVAEGVDVCLCGDAASDPDLAPLLVGLGVTELSATPASVPAVKDALRRSSLTDLQDLAARALRADSAAEVRELLRG